MRNTRFAPGNYYHVYNRGSNKQQIFFNDKDYLRFLFLITHMQANFPLTHTSRLLKDAKSIDEVELEENYKDILKDSKNVELVCYSLMPNHFHLLLYEAEESGISRYMQRVLNAYTKFFNKKYDKTGHLFQGPFGAVPVRTDEQILYLSAYIHANPIAVVKDIKRLEKYQWSSYVDYVNDNRWPHLLNPSIVIEQFADGDDYKKFVEKSGAKGVDLI